MAAPKIENYQFGRIEIDGHAYTNDVIILPDHIVDNWWRKEGHVLHPEDLDVVFDAAPEMLVVGQGASGRMRVTDATRRRLESAGIALVALNSHEAVDRYNDLRTQKEIAAALHLTC